MAIMGPSGSGKSTLLGLLAGLDARRQARFAWMAKKSQGFRKTAWQFCEAAKSVSYSSPINSSRLSRLRRMFCCRTNWSGRTASMGGAGRELLADVGLADRRDHYPVQLSGGEQQRVALARAFMVRPPILMADEPTGNLDSANGQHVLDLLISLNAQQGTTLVLVTHDQQLASYADRRIMLHDGLVVADEPR